MKKVTIMQKPSVHRIARTPDRWVSENPTCTEPMKRLTIDIPFSLHQQVKSRCALEGAKMADVVRELLENRFRAEPRPATQPQNRIS